ncbi:MAG: FKBP-type peptidyl-prolyl cis-trans isomerase [Halioglobus sp.]
MKIEDGRIVEMHYKLVDGEGQILDQSTDAEPLSYQHGVAGILPALQLALEGKVKGEAFDISLHPNEAYGEYSTQAVHNVPRSQFPAEMELEVGTQIMDENQEMPFPATITATTTETVTVDANHPLAGKSLRFTGEIIEVSEPTEDE